MPTLELHTVFQAIILTKLTTVPVHGMVSAQPKSEIGWSRSCDGVNAEANVLLRLVASDQKYSTLSKQTSAAVTGHVTNSVKARLRQCHTIGDPCISDRSTPVNTPRCSTSGE